MTNYMGKRRLEKLARHAANIFGLIIPCFFDYTKFRGSEWIDVVGYEADGYPDSLIPYNLKIYVSDKYVDDNSLKVVRIQISETIDFLGGDFCCLDVITYYDSNFKPFVLEKKYRYKFDERYLLSGLEKNGKKVTVNE